MPDSKRKKRAVAKRRAHGTNEARATLKHRSKTGQFARAPHKVSAPAVGGAIRHAQPGADIVMERATGRLHRLPAPPPGEAA